MSSSFLERIYTLLGATGTTSTQLQESLTKTEALYNEVSLRIYTEAPMTLIPAPVERTRPY